ncbi:hypothetical protein [Butyrivibrio sp. AE3006]|uniref:hypothetical protein n=1 Tax=Butyrivibrio sp. AE3006 TaxID=1280673 RepID=UPI000419C44A|nr:hypothetical protein [Butyrivibrio sp. AE3006]
MADNIRNFNDYRKKVNIENQDTEEINIEIQDPLDFLSASEREEYYRTQHEAMDRERESLDEDSSEFYFDDEPPKQQRDETGYQVREEQEDIEDYEYEERPARRPVREPARKPSRKAEKKVSRKEEKKTSRKVVKETSRDRGRRGRDEDDWFDEDEDMGGGINPYVVVRIASALTGIFILILMGMIFKVKVYDVYLKPDPDEVRGTVQVGQVAGYTYTDDKVVTTTELNLRNTPSTVSDDFIEVQVPEGTVLDRIAVSDDGVWAQVEYEDKVLYCVMKYLRVEE